jgi:ribonuclease-3 family protein
MALNQDIINYFDGKDIDIRTYSPLTLAYIGDDVFEMDYTLDTLCNSKGKFNSLKTTLSVLNLDNKQKFFDKKVYIKFLKTDETSELFSRELPAN